MKSAPSLRWNPLTLEMSKTKFTATARQTQDQNDFSLSMNETVSHKTREKTTSNKEGQEPLLELQTSHKYQSTTRRRELERTRFIKSVLEAYGIVPVEGDLTSESQKNCSC